MKKFIAILILIFTLQTPSWADDIRDFQIEGVSIGDSALDYFSEEKILNNRATYFKNKTYTPVEIFYEKSFEIYDAVQFGYKTGDKNYTILGLAGNIEYPNNVKSCYKKMDEIVTELTRLFKNIAQITGKETEVSTIDKPGDTRKASVAYWFDSKDVVVVACYDYSEESGYTDNLSVSVDTKEYNEFLGIAYK